MTIAVIGTGRVGGTLGRRWAEAGHDVVFGTRTGGVPAEGGVPSGARAASIAHAGRGAEVVVLAVPYPAVPDVLAAVGPLAGKVVLDVTNPVGRSGGQLVVGDTGGYGSGGERTAALAPGGRVVKSLNTVGWEIMADPLLGGRRAVMPLAGDDDGARATVAELVAALGFEPFDVGPLLRARELEHQAILWISLAAGGRGRDWAFGLLQR